MKPFCQEGNIQFCFHEATCVLSYEQTGYYQSIKGKGKKAVDIVAHEDSKASRLWYIEVKDFRVITRPPKPSNFSDLPQTFFDKCNDTRSGLQTMQATQPANAETQMAQRMMTARSEHAVLHLESHQIDPTYMFPSAKKSLIRQRIHILFINAGLNMKALVVDSARTQPPHLPWTTVLLP